ncbi:MULTISPECIES: outer membrane protein assembly factor BamE [Sphingomonas]|uniref:Outer membrane protein assembly factor BamE n=1 Tax=Sphingomonas kyungheensis TaxID=1069987 RepID=A0ABU8H3X9_9SPHN|nr:MULTISPECIES: outer membrane protein assembly factor BamE [unclassified Sphingomonas]EZP51007.1 SmpA / OmlA family protein [Sphingomonas sp. RIT328]
MSVSLARIGLLAGLGLTVAAGGCAPLRSHQGYIIDADLVNSVQPGVDNRQSVASTLGQPTIASQFAPQDWYYVARDSRNLNFQKPKPKDQIALKISFDAKGTVTSVTRTGVDQIASIDPYGKTTPTLGRKRGFFEDLFGNIGTVGAAGAGGGAGRGTGGGRDTP